MAEEVLDKLLKETDVYLSKILNRGGEDLQEDAVDDGLVITEQPRLIEGHMRSYQIEGLDWLAQLTKNGVNGILADEMGLGKTLQSISILALAKERQWKEDMYPHVIVCPKSTISNWEKEFGKFCPSLSTCCLIGSQEERAQIIEQVIKPGAYKVLITSFDVCRIEIASLKKIKFGFFIIDEAHRIKNEESVLSAIVRTVQAERVFLLTGTPLQNNLHELWAILNFIMPNIFSSASDFDYIFDRIVNAGNQETVVSTLHRILRPFMLRRLKTDVARDLPEKKELYVYVGLSAVQKQIYKDIVLKNADSLLNASAASMGKTRLVNTLMQLRKCCNHPYLFPGIEPGPPFKEGPHLVDNSGKLAVMDKLIDRILFGRGGKNQILIFSQMTRMLDILDDYCRFKQIARARIDGSTPSSERQLMIDDFSRHDSDKQIFLLSTRAGGLGINLTSANFVIIFDADFNPQSDLQAIDRAHRIGQRRPVTVYRFVSRGTVEEKIIEKAAKKMMIDKLVIRKSTSQQNNANNVSKDELGHILRFGVTELFSASPSQEGREEDIDALLKFSEHKTCELSNKIKSLDSFQLKFDSSIPSQQQVVLPEEVRVAAAAVEVQPVFLVEGPRERKPILVPEPPRTAPLMKTKLAEWRAKVGGGQDYQFYNHKRLDELEKIEKSSSLKKLNRAQKTEQETLLAQGFPNFTRRCFHTVVRMLEEYGHSDATIDQICEALRSERSPEELKRYVATLMAEGGKFLGDHFMVRFLNKVKRVEKNNEKINSQMDSLNRKINARDFKNVWLELPVDSAYIDAGSPWTNEADRIVLCGIYYFGYGSWGSVKQLLSLHPKTCFNFPLLALTEAEIKARSDELLEIVQEEFPVPTNRKKLKTNQ